MTKATISPTKKYQRLEIQPKMSSKDYQTAWLALEKMGREVNRLWRAKKNSLDILKEERQ